MLSWHQCSAMERFLSVKVFKMRKNQHHPVDILHSPVQQSGKQNNFIMNISPLTLINQRYFDFEIKLVNIIELHNKYPSVTVITQLLN